MSIMIVDSDYSQREHLKKMILSISDMINIYETDHPDTALRICKNNHIDMFLFDINLRESSGLELAKKIRKINKYQFSPLVFLSDNLEYLTQAFKQTHCYDYILKPYNKKDVAAILDKLISHEINILHQIKHTNPQKISVTLTSGICAIIKVDDILFIEVMGRICQINTLNEIYITKNLSLRKLLALIDCHYILQSHKSFAVNTKHISSFEKVSSKLNVISFNNTSKTALLGYKFKKNVLSDIPFF